MSVLKKYNSETKQWEVVASSSASEISVRSESLLNEGQKETNVESVLQKFNTDINTLKGNVSWLAEHGGGGSGSGGGGGTVITDAVIKVNGKDTGSDIIFTESEGLNIIVQSKSSTARWAITASAGRKIIKSINNVSKVVITSKDLQKAGVTQTFNLSITAYDDNTLTSIYWDGKVLMSTVKIYTTEPEYKFEFTQIDESTAVFPVNYEIGVVASYILLVNDLQYDVFNLTTNTGEIQVDIKVVQQKLSEQKKDLLQPGANSISIKLQQAQDATIISQPITVGINLITDTPIISCSLYSKNSDKRTEVAIPALSADIIKIVPYIVYYTAGSFKAQIYTASDISDNSKKVSWENITTYNYYNAEYNNASVVVNIDAYDKDFIIKIVILDTITNTEYEQPFYCVSVLPNYQLLDNGITPIFNFQTYNVYLKDNQWKSSNDSKNIQLDVFNSNIKSENILVSDNRSLRLQNTAYGVFSLNTPSTNKTFWQNYFNITAVKEFTLNICYRADFHPDDNRTILQFADLDNSTKLPIKGIVIRDHCLYVSNYQFQLEDSELLDITITFKQNTSEEAIQGAQGNVFVYVNGVVETVFSDISVDYLIPETQKYIYIAASKQDESSDAIYFTDTSIYRVALYNKCLTPMQVLYDYLNNEAYTHLTSQYEPDTTYISDGLKRNFITTEPDGSHQSLLYNTTQAFDNNSTDFSDNFLFTKLISTSGTNVNIRADISNYIIPIPIMLIDVSKADSWSWSNFITPSSNITTAENCSFEYYDQNGTNASIIKGNCDVGLQGTSTLSDAIKNLEIVLADDTVFVPKETWFPEKHYVLKADIVDSSHSLNTSIGKFVNEEFGMKYNEDGTLANTESWYPFSETVKSSFIAAKNDKSNKMNTYFPKGTLKHGVEGFPIFLIMKFKETSNEDSGLHSMGIYQFILGRKSPRNLGYEIIKNVTSSDGEDPTGVTYPFYKTGVNIEVKENKGYWIELNLNTPFDNDTKFAELDDLSKAKLTGIFWQPVSLNKEWYDYYFENKYDNLGTDSVQGNLSNFKPFVDFVDNIIKLPVNNRRYCVPNASILQQHTFINTTYPQYKATLGNTSYVWNEVANSSNTIYPKGDDMGGVIEKLNIHCYSKYFVLAMFFGLIDNFGKNMPIKFYQKADGTWEAPIFGIYDTDTGIGGDNQGLLDVSVQAWLSNITNRNGVFCESSDLQDTTGQRTTIYCQNNKLWYFDCNETMYSEYSGDVVGSYFASYWNSFIQVLKNTYAHDDTYSINTLNDLVTLYYNKYFLTQTNGCGELLFNLTYFTKYLNYYVNSSGTGMSNQSSKLHGRRQQQVQHWMKQRVNFLDSIYNAMGNNVSVGGTDIQIQPTNISLNAGLRPSFDFVTNYPIITCAFNQQRDSKIYIFLPKNIVTPIPWGGYYSDEKFLHGFSYADAFQRIGSTEDTSLSEMWFLNINSGMLPNITIFNASGDTQLAEQGENAVKYFLYNNKSELRTINLENTAKPSVAGFNYVLNLQSGFSKLQVLKLFNSCVSSIKLSDTEEGNIPLAYIDIRGSQLQNLSLSSQNLLENLDVTDCNILSDIEITNCKNIKNLNINNTQKNLQTITINSSTFESLICDNNPSIKSITINSDNLKTVKISNCPKLTSVNISGNKLVTLQVTNNSSLTNLNLTGVGNIQLNLTSMDLSDTPLSYIAYDSTKYEEGLINLQRFIKLASFKLQNNSKVAYIRFNNDKNRPINLDNTFKGCSNLTRVYGHIQLSTSFIFNECSKFSILGGFSYNNIDMRDSSGRVKHFTEFNNANIISNNKPAFQTPYNSTNITFNVTDARSMFASTACNLLDLYYVFFNIGPVTNCQQLFYRCGNIDYSWTNSCDNSLNRKTFINCGNVTNMYYAIPGITKPTRFFSPTHNSTTVTADDGLFSPLINCTDISGDNLNGPGFLNASQGVMDRFFFRRANGNYKLQKIQNQVTKWMVDNVNTMQYVPTDADLINYYESWGNFTDFFKNMPDVTDYSGFNCGYYFVNFKTVTLPHCVKITNGFLLTKYGINEIKFQNIFPDISKLVQLEISFAISGEGDATDTNSFYTKVYTDSSKVNKSVLYFNDTTFKGCTNLRTLGSASLNNPGFSGNGLIKTFNTELFPYNIFSECPQLQTIGSLFKNSEKGDLIITNPIELPGTLFVNNKNLQRVVGTFQTLPFKFKLTSNSFKNCPNLTDVTGLFANNQDNFTGSIPKKLFYHGDARTVKVTYEGANLWNADKTEFTYNPLSVDSSGNQIGIKDSDKKVVTITYTEVNNNITTMHHCFYDCNIDAYTNTSPTVENNSEYFPFTHIIQNGQVKNVSQQFNDNPNTCMWEYDGEHLPSGYTGENLDESYDLNASKTGSIILFGTGENTYSIGPTINYICAPDLFRYCKNSSSLSIQNIFENCGYRDSNNDKQQANPKLDFYGLKGRIVPYLFKPISEVTDISNMFSHCTCLSPYITEITNENPDGNAYVIPKTLFKYAPKIIRLSNTFEGCTFPYNINLQVFSPLINSLYIDRIFKSSRFNGTATKRANVSGVFTNKYIQNAKYAFAAGEWGEKIVNTYNRLWLAQYVTFSGVFTKNNVTNDISVFDGYSASTVKFANKTLQDRNYNYRTS